MVRGLAEGLDERLGQRAAGHARPRGRGVGGAAKARRGAQLGAVQVHGQPGRVLQRGAQARGVVGDVGYFFHLHQLADAQRAAGQLVDPGQVRQVGLAGELRQRRARQMVGLVHDQQAVVQFGQQPRADGRQQQVMVGHDDLGGHQVLAPLVVGAARKQRAVLAGARVRLGRHGRPGLGLGLRLQGVAVAVPGAAPQRVGHAGVELHARLLGLARGGPGRLGGAEQVFGGRPVLVLVQAAAGQALQLELAHVAPPPLGQGEAHRLAQVRHEGRQVLVHQLLLQRHGGRGDQHPRAARQRHGNRRSAVGQRLAHARAGLDDGDGARGLGILVLGLAQLGGGEGLRHLLGHAPLAFARAKAGGGLHHRLEAVQGLVGPLLRGHGRMEKTGGGRGRHGRGGGAENSCAFVQLW